MEKSNFFITICLSIYTKNIYTLNQNCLTIDILLKFTDVADNNSNENF